ncbi:MAG: hypothetical protein V4726_00230 [Verrucomicrobiota bacterium]
MKKHQKLLSLLLIPGVLSVAGALADTDVRVVPKKELFITDSAVMESPRAGKNGPWHIKEVLRRIAGNNPDGTAADVEQFAEAWFATWEKNTTVPETASAFTARSWVAAALRSAWKEDRIRLIAVVNRLDLTKFPHNDRSRLPVKLGEGRFIYEVMKNGSNPEPFTLIFEYRLPGDSSQENLQQWAADWHRLGSFTDFNQDYLDALAEITGRFSAHGMLNQVRTNEIIQPSGPAPAIWELREFHFHGGKRSLEQEKVGLTPSADFAGSDKLRQFVELKTDPILQGAEVEFPPQLAGATARVPNLGFTWKIFPGDQPERLQRAGFIVSFNTCSGCHAGDTGTPFQHIGVRAPNLSDFLTGQINLAHRLPGQAGTAHNEMGIRESLLKEFLRGPSAADDPELKASLIARAARVH